MSAGSGGPFRPPFRSLALINQALVLRAAPIVQLDTNHRIEYFLPNDDVRPSMGILTRWKLPLANDPQLYSLRLRD